MSQIAIRPIILDNFFNHSPIIAFRNISYRLTLIFFDNVIKCLPRMRKKLLVNRVVEQLDSTQAKPTPSPSPKTIPKMPARIIVPLKSSTDPVQERQFDSKAIENMRKVLGKLPDTIVLKLLWDVIPILGDQEDKTFAGAIRTILDEKMVVAIREFDPDAWENVVGIVHRFSDLIRDFTKDKSISNIQILDEFFKHITNELIGWLQHNYPEIVTGREEEMQGHITHLMREKINDKKFKNLSNFVINLYRFGLTGLRKFVDNHEFRNRIESIFTGLEQPAKELLEQNLHLLDLPVRNALKITENISADKFFDTIIDVAHNNVEGIQKATTTQNQHLITLRNRKNEKKKEIEGKLQEKRTFLQEARAASKILSASQELAQDQQQKLDKIQEFLSDVETFQGDDESYIKAQIHKVYQSTPEEKIDFIVEREVCRSLLNELFDQLGGNSIRMKGLFVKWVTINTNTEHPRPMQEIMESFFRDPPSMEDLEPDPFDGDLMKLGTHLETANLEEFNRVYNRAIQRTWVQRKTFADYIREAQSAPQVAKIVTNRNGMSLEDLKEETVNNIAKQLCQTMFPPVQHTFVDGTQKEVNGIYRIWSHLQFPDSLQERLNSIQTLIMETLSDSDIPESDKAHFHRNLLAFSEMFLMEFMQLEVKQLIKLGLNKGLEQVLDPVRFDLLLANKILPLIDNQLFLGHASLLMRQELQTFLPLYFEFHKAETVEKRTAEIDKIAGHMHMLLKRKVRDIDEIGYTKEKIVELITPSSSYAQALERFQLQLAGPQPAGFLENFMKNYLLNYIKENATNFAPHYQSLLQKDESGVYRLAESEGLRDAISNHLYQVVQRDLKHYYLDANGITPPVFSQWIKPLVVDRLTDKLKTELETKLAAREINENNEAKEVESALSKQFVTADIPHMGSLINGVVQLGDLNGWLARWGVNRFQTMIGTIISNGMMDIRESWGPMFQGIAEALIPLLDPAKFGEILNDRGPLPDIQEAQQQRMQRVERVTVPLLKNYLDEVIDDLPYGTGRLASWFNVKPSKQNLVDTVKTVYDRMLADRERRQVLALNVVHAIEAQGIF